MQPQESRVLVVAPVGQDAEAMAGMLRSEGVAAQACAGVSECLERLESGAGAVLLTEEALELPGAEELLENLTRQPAWSELPLIILTSGGETRFARLLELAQEVAGAVTLLERPMRTVTLLQAVRVALRSRGRQYQVRDLLAERERAAQELRESEARLVQAVRVGRVGTFEHDHPSDRIEYSLVMRELVGFKEGEEVTLSGFLSKVIPEDRPGLAEAIRRAHDPTGTGAFERECRVNAGEGKRRWLSLRAQTFFEGEQHERRAVRTIGAALDVTGRKDRQAELERLVEERTAALRELVGELEHFSYSITHDMRAPLRAMMGFAEVAKEMCSQSGRQEQELFLERIQTAGRRMDLLITDALNYSKAVRSELPLAPVDVGRLLRGMVDTYPELQSAEGAIRIEVEMPQVMGNEAGLTQCFSNLLVNAVKFAKPGEPPQVRVWAERVGSGEDGVQNNGMDGEWVRIWVEDRGIGIGPKMLPRVFDMFARGASKRAGTGIGLALVRKVAERMGGRVGVESEEGRGSRFWMELRPGEVRRRAGLNRGA